MQVIQNAVISNKHLTTKNGPGCGCGLNCSGLFCGLGCGLCIK